MWHNEQSLHGAIWGLQASCLRSLSLTVLIYNLGLSSPCPSGLWAVKGIMGMSTRGIGGALLSLAPEPGGESVVGWAPKPPAP